MKRVYFIIFILLFYYIYPKEITIGISEPFVALTNSETIFLSKQFPFEILFENDKENLKFNIVRIESFFSEIDYLKSLRLISLKEEYDYFVYSYISSNKGEIVFLVKIINTFSGKIVYSSIFLKEKDMLVNEFLMEIVKRFLDELKGLEFYKEGREKRILNNLNLNQNIGDKKFKHEIFLLNSFFKNHSLTFSLTELIVGYSFNIVNNLCVESGLFLGLGEKSNDFRFIKIESNNLYMGSFFSFFVFYPFFIEPRLGLRFELIFFTDKVFCFSFPIDFGIKFFINKRNAIKLGSSFQIVSLKVKENKLLWEQDYLLGMMIGYAFKVY